MTKDTEAKSFSGTVKEAHMWSSAPEGYPMFNPGYYYQIAGALPPCSMIVVPGYNGYSYYAPAPPPPLLPPHTFVQNQYTPVVPVNYGFIGQSAGVNQSTVNSATSEGRNVYVKGLPEHASDEYLRELAEPIGKVASTKATLELADGKDKCKGYGFICFESKECAGNAVEYLNSRGFTASLAKESLSYRLKQLQDEHSTNVYFSNIPITLDEAQFHEIVFGALNCGNGGEDVIESVKILRDRAGLSRGVGFIRFTSRTLAEEAIKKLNGHLLEGCFIPLQVRFADSSAQKSLKRNTFRDQFGNGFYRRDDSLVSLARNINDGTASTPDFSASTTSLPPNCSLDASQSTS